MPASEGRVIELNEWIMNSMNETELGNCWMNERILKIHERSINARKKDNESNSVTNN